MSLQLFGLRNKGLYAKPVYTLSVQILIWSRNIIQFPTEQGFICCLFYNSEIIFDRFHVINNLSRALLKTRIDAMKRLSTQSMEFKRLKRYWRLIQMDWDKLDSRDFKHFTHFKEIQTEYGVIRQSIEVYELLQETYEIYQLLLKAIQDGDSARLRKLLNLFKNQGLRDIQTAIKTMLDNYKYVENALIYPYFNGFTEGMNNYIKVLKRVAFGYKSFFHFRNRILIARKLPTLFDKEPFLVIILDP